MKQDREFVHKEVLKIFPWIKPRTLISWSERGLVKTKGGDAPGRGTRRRYSYQNVIEIGFVDELLQYGLPFHTIKRIIEAAGLSQRLREKGFDTVFWARREIPVVPSTQEVQYRELIRGVTLRWMTSLETLEEFQDSTDKKLLGLESHSVKPGGPFSKTRVVSCIVVNIQNVKKFVDDQIEDMIEGE